MTHCGVGPSKRKSGALPRTAVLLGVLVIIVGVLVVHVRLGPGGSMVGLAWAAQASRGAAAKKPPRLFRGVTVKQLRRIEGKSKVLSRAPITVRAVTKQGSPTAFDVRLVESVYHVELTATLVATGKPYNWDRPLRCVSVQPIDESIQFEWAMWDTEVLWKPRVYTEPDGTAYVCWQQYFALCLLEIARPRPRRNALKEDFAWGFVYPDVMFDLKREAPPGAWKRIGMHPRMELVSLRRLQKKQWEIIVRNPTTGLEYRFESADGWSWSYAPAGDGGR